jgi:hypothetical protein
MFVALLLLPGASAHAAGPARAHAAPPARAQAGPPTRLRADWRWPLHGPLVGHFRLTPRVPYAGGQRRGIDVVAPPGTAVRAACAGRVTFTGSLPRFGRAVSMRCGALIATYLRLARVQVARGAIIAPGQPLGTLGAAGVLRLGARRATDRRAYLDPLTLLRDPDPRLPDLGPAPRSRRPGVERPQRPRLPAARPPVVAPHALTPRPPAAPASPPRAAPTPPPRLVPAPRRAVPHRLPWPAYPALALIATALPVGGVVRLRRRGRHAVGAATAH